jgi:hypothetical protein
VADASQAKALWEQLGEETVALMSGACRYLATLWESAWLEGKGSKRFRSEDLKAVPRDYLKELYLWRDFLPDRSLEELEHDLADGVGFAPGPANRK